ncbi:MAG: DUF2835 domain-containing protein [Deltaproteobacteria bacterium]|nr:DUF2835 domain-containing protein [Deltaproteobacteria bacterium]
MREKTNRIRFSLSISSDMYLSYYRGEAEYVFTRSHEGKSVKFPARYLRKFVTHEGISGEFEIEFDHNNRLKDMRRIR